MTYSYEYKGHLLVEQDPQMTTVDTILPCEYCGEEIEAGSDAVELFFGVSGPGETTGKPMVVNNPEIEFPYANLHPACVLPYMRTNYDTGVEEYEELEAALDMEPSKDVSVLRQLVNYIISGARSAGWSAIQIEDAVDTLIYQAGLTDPQEQHAMKLRIGFWSLLGHGA